MTRCSVLLDLEPDHVSVWPDSTAGQRPARSETTAGVVAGVADGGVSAADRTTFGQVAGRGTPLRVQLGLSYLY